MGINEHLGERLRALRLARGLSQDQLAHFAKMDRVYLGQVERGMRSASVETVAKLAEALDVPLAEVFRWKARLPRTNPAHGSERLAERIGILAHDASKTELELFEKLAEVFFSAHHPRRKRR